MLANIPGSDHPLGLRELSNLISRQGSHGGPCQLLSLPETLSVRGQWESQHDVEAPFLPLAVDRPEVQVPSLT